MFGSGSQKDFAVFSSASLKLLIEGSGAQTDLMVAGFSG